MKLNPLFCLALVPLVIFPLAGCAQPNNDRLALGGV